MGPRPPMGAEPQAPPPKGAWPGLYLQKGRSYPALGPAPKRGVALGGATVTPRGYRIPGNNGFTVTAYSNPATRMPNSRSKHAKVLGYPVDGVTVSPDPHAELSLKAR